MGERFKNILCLVSGDMESLFMLNDEDGTVVNGYDLYAIDDEFFKDDIEAAKRYAFDTICVYNRTGAGCKWLQLL